MRVTRSWVTRASHAAAVWLAVGGIEANHSPVHTPPSPQSGRGVRSGDGWWNRMIQQGSPYSIICSPRITAASLRCRPPIIYKVYMYTIRTPEGHTKSSTKSQGSVNPGDPKREDCGAPGASALARVPVKRNLGGSWGLGSIDELTITFPSRLCRSKVGSGGRSVCI